MSEQPVAARSDRRHSVGTEHAAASDDGDSNIGFYVVIALVFGGNLKVAAAWKPSRCTLCPNTIHRNYYRWTIDGRRHYLCPECNRRQRRWSSASAGRR